MLLALTTLVRALEDMPRFEGADGIPDVGVTLKRRPNPVTTGRLARTAFLVVLIVLALGPQILDSRIPAQSSPAILATLASIGCILTHSGLPSLRTTGR